MLALNPDLSAGHKTSVPGPRVAHPWFKWWIANYMYTFDDRELSKHSDKYFYKIASAHID